MKRLKGLVLLILSTFILWSCTYDKEPIPDECLGNIIINLQSKNDASCSQRDGDIAVTASGGDGDYTYSINGGALQTGALFSSLAAGSYSIVASDGICTAELSVEILNADGVNATVQATQSSCDNSTGTITVDALGGVTPYEYKIGTGDFQAQSSFSSLSPGDYDIVVKDAEGCEVQLQAKVNSDVTFGNIKSIIEINCAISGCHSGSQSPNFTIDANIKGSANRIQARSSARSMPPSSSGLSLSQTQIDQIACWVADGANIN
ncbi:MAG: hypothetical protein ACJAS3_000610 [Roseivirga sp.]|jgi:hypothetical protein